MTERKLWAVFNGYMKNGALAIVVEADSEEAARDTVKTGDLFANEGGHEGRTLTVEPFELGKVIELG